jgi:plasmid stabilization system protein ParE
MNYSFLEPAKAELADAVAQYEEARPGLGEEFAEEVEHSIQRILNHPRAWSPLGKEIRRCRTNGFSYGLVYTVRNNEVIIIAVMHFHRRPGYWKDRLH